MGESRLQWQQNFQGENTHERLAALFYRTRVQLHIYT